MRSLVFKRALLALAAVALPLGGYFLYAHFHARAEAELRVHKFMAQQPYLELNDDVGFLWKKNLNVTFPANDWWLDVKKEGVAIEPIVTDGHGFKNDPAAIAQLATATPNIIGLGDSFIHEAAGVFYDFFKKHGQFYYSLAMQRQCPPQYNAILTRYALPLHPQHILYGVYENDFQETEDYREWKESGLDWFAYHGGTWCGPAITPPRKSEAALVGEEMADVLQCIVSANTLCLTNHVDFTLMLIPSKAYVVEGNHASIYETVCYDVIKKEALQRGIRVIDLREVFSREPEPAGLYWKTDGHWSHRGMEIAVQTYFQALSTPTPAKP
jgi:hypothetical protein